MYKNNCLISSIILLIIGIIYLFLFKEKNILLGLVVVVLGLTSIKHHSRLDKWIIRDCWFYLDIIMVGLFFIIFSYYNLNSLRWKLLIILSIIVYIYTINFCEDCNKPFYHSLIHYFVIIFLITDIILYYQNKKN